MIILHGLEQFAAAITEKVAQMRAAPRVATGTALHLIERRAQEKLGERSHQAGTPTPSGPGQPPALITGTLRRSIKVTGPDPDGPSGWRGRVGPTAVYGRIQELGGVARGRTLPPRPYLRPAFEEVRGEIAATFRAAWTKAIIK
jgi:hypothetical protein